MLVTTGFAGREEAIIDVFRAAFAASEGGDEGDVIAGLVRRIFTDTPGDDLSVFTMEDGGEVIGAVAFTRLRYPEDAQSVMLLSPMAVAPARWKQGVGQALISEALAALSQDGVDVTLTYGDPNYYGQVGFLPISEANAEPPMPLSMPHGWLGQRLDGGGRPSLLGRSQCVAAFRRPEYW